MSPSNTGGPLADDVDGVALAGRVDLDDQHSGAIESHPVRHPAGAISAQVRLPPASQVGGVRLGDADGAARFGADDEVGTPVAEPGRRLRVPVGERDDALGDRALRRTT